MNVRRWMAWVAVGGIVAASCAVDERKLAVLGGEDGGPDASGGVERSARLEVTPSALDLGWVTTGFAARGRLLVRNTGDAPLPPPVIGWSTGSDPDFVVIQNRCEAAIPPGESCEIRLQVVPSRAGALQGTLQVQGSAGSADVGVAALGMQAGDLILAPAAGSFEDYGGVLVGAVEEGTFTLSNPGGASTGPLQLGVNRPEFAFVAPAPGECTSGVTALEPGQSCDLRLAFSPTARGVLDATLTIATEAAGSVSLTLGGRGLVPGVLETSAPALDFEGVLLLQSARRSVTLRNGGDEPLELAGASLAPAGVVGFTISSSDCAAATLLEGGQSCSVEVEFRPQSTGEEVSAELVVSHVGAAQPLSVPLRGIGLVPGSLELGPVTAGEGDFGDVLVGESAERVFQIVNPGAQPSGVLGWTLSEGFEVVAPPAEGECVPGSSSLVDGQACTLRVKFSPERREPASGSLIVDSPLAGAVAMPLSGRGVIAGQLQADPEVSFGRVLTAATAERSVTLTNVGDQPLAPPTLTLSGADPAQVAAFSFQSGCTAPLALGQECTVTLAFAPTVAVPHAATLALLSEPSPPLSVLLLGEALVPGSLVLAAAAGGTTEFGDVAIGSSLSRSFTLTNPGAVPSGALTISTDDNQFEVALGDCNAGDPAGLVDGSSCTFSVSFTPADSLAAAANVTVQSPGAGRAGIAVTGRGRNPAALSATGNRDLGRANIGQAALTAPENEFTWTVNNTGDLATGALAVANDNPTEFTVGADTCQGAELAGKASCTMTIRFRPGGTGPRTGRITVSDPVGMLSAPIALTGLGVQLAGPGQSCVNAECQTGECTRAGVCCDTACDRTCEVCSAAGVCTPLSGRQPCGNGAACFGVDQCKLPEGVACTALGGADQCGSGFCEVRFGGAGAGDRICCLEACAPGLACNAQGRCEQPTAGDGAVCGRPGDLPCGAGLLCKPCVGSAAGQSQCKPAAACCGDCPAGLECADGASCQCPVGPNGLRGLPCAGGCATNQLGACCPEAPGCDPGLTCDPFDNLCKECLSSADCQGRACNGGVCAAAECTAGQRRCSNGTPQLCGANGLYANQPACGGGQQCNPTTGQCACASGQPCFGACVDTNADEGNCGACGNACGAGEQCIAGVCSECQAGERRCASLTQPQSCFNGTFINDFGCLQGQECQGAGECVNTAPVLPEQGEVCSGGQCAAGLTCVSGVCCNRACQGLCEVCNLGAGVCELPPGGRCFPPGALSQDGVCREVDPGFVSCETREVSCNGSTCTPAQTCCLGGAGFGCLAAATSCSAQGPRLECDEDTDCPQGETCCYDRAQGRVACIASGQCQVSAVPLNPFNPQDVPAFSPLCDSPAGQGSAAICTAQQRQCEPLPDGPDGWQVCGRPL